MEKIPLYCILAFCILLALIGVALFSNGAYIMSAVCWIMSVAYGSMTIQEILD